MTKSEYEQKRYSGNVPGRLKMEYVAQCLAQASGEKINVFSLCFSQKGFQRRNTADYDGMRLIHMASFCNSGFLRKAWNRVLLPLQLFFYLLSTRKGDTILFYHSVKSTRIIKKLSKVIKRNYICEIEEIYGYAADKISPNVGREIDDLHAFDKYIVVNDELPKCIGIADKKYCVCYGVYQVLERMCQRLQDGKTHIVYAGTIETKKQGALTAVSVAKYLDDRYCLHVAGFGTESAVNNIKKLIEENNRENDCKIVFHGFLSGDALEQLYWQSHIGLSTYVMNDKFSNCSFPSKLTTYTAHDLAVVVCDHNAYRHSKLANNWLFFKKLSPQDVASVIETSNIDFDFTNADRISQLHESFVEDLKELLSEVKE